MMAKPAIINTMKKLVSLKGIDFCILIRKEGDVLAKVGVKGGRKTGELGTFAATAFGGIVQAQKRMDKKYPNDVLIRDNEGSTIINVVNKDVFLVARISSTEISDKVLDKIENTSWSINREL